MKRAAFAALALALATVLSPQTIAPLAPQVEMTRRFALVAGANWGGPGRERLRYAVSDAMAFLNILETLGGVAPDDSRLLVEPDRDTFFWEMGRLRDRIVRARESSRRVEVVIYYSGHADEQGILLGRQKIAYQELNGQLESLRADARIAILDSCASGAFIRGKGGQKSLPFLFNVANDMKGLAVMTSSSADEVTQESDRIRGSFFTFHLLAGLRGAADDSRDGLITLNEAYQYAFRETLSQTEKTRSGPQHPKINIQMSGSGDLVLTDIRKGDARLLLGSVSSGSFFLHGPDGSLVMEFHKQPGVDLELALGSGKYRVTSSGGGSVREAFVSLEAGQATRLDEQQFHVVQRSENASRGDLDLNPPGAAAIRHRATFFITFMAKVSRYDQRWTFMPGMLFGVELTRSFSLALAGFGRIGPEASSRPPFWGLNFDLVLFERGRLGVTCGANIGFMYKDAQDEEAMRLSTILEPGFGATWRLNSHMKLTSHISLDFVNGASDNLGRFSLGVGLVIGR